MKRREFAQSAIYTPLTAAGAEAGNNQSTLQEIATRFFHSLEDFTTEERSQQIVECSNKICVEEDIPEETTGELIEKSSELPDQIRRIRFAIQILKEYNITSTLDESMVQQAGNNARKITNFIPLIGSLNNLQAAACNISSEPSPKEIERFLYACIAFGLEVGLWYSTAPYQMAWRGTRFVSNRTFLRYARHGCANCVALIMSELHWALRRMPQSTLSNESVEAFVLRKIGELQKFAEQENYKVDLEISREDIRKTIDSTTTGGGALYVAQGRQNNLFSDSNILIALIALGAYVFYN